MTPDADGASAAARHRVGEYLLRAPDYEQLQRWARALGMTPTDVLAVLQDTTLHAPADLNSVSVGNLGLHVAHGAFLSLVWDFDRLPLTLEDWVPGLLLTELCVRGIWPGSRSKPLRPGLPYLGILRIGACNLGALDLSQVPSLGSLLCVGNRLRELNLGALPQLRVLECSYNALCTLNLSGVPALQGLICRGNRLSTLQLGDVPALQALDCSHNQLAALDLTGAPVLEALASSANPLRALDTTPTPQLANLWVDARVKLPHLPPGCAIHPVTACPT